MLKTYVIILLVLCPSVPLILNTDNEIIATESQSHTKPYIESFLRQDLESYQSSMGAGSSTKAAMLQFENELDASELAFAESVGIRFRTRGQHLVHVGSTYLCDVNNINALGALSDIGLKRATSGGKKFHSSIESSVPAIDAPAVWNNLKKDGEMINGSGATVAVIDTGATWLHPTFWRVTEMDVVVLEDNGAFYADLNENGVPDDGEGPLKQSDGQAPSTIDVSNEYLFIDAEDNDQFSYDEGDRWLAGIDSNDDGILTLPEENVALLGESKVKTFYDQTENQVYARGVNLTSEALPGGDNNGHGTHVASTIAGGQIGLTSMVGVAPGVDLVIIKSPLTSASILDAIHFAILHEADIINMSFSSYLGFLDGTDLEDLAATDAFLQNDTLCTAAAGNLGGRSKHSRFNVPSGGDAGTTLSVSNPPDYSFLNMIWYSSDQDESVILSPPYGGEDVTLGPIDEMVGSVYSVKTNDIHAYAFVDVNSRGFNRLIVQISESNHNWTSGTWTVTLENPSGNSVTV
ncbi:MAG: S8 family serine peptidase, partial [Promethearchaeati archaeon]